MAFIRTKKIKGKEYAYLVESKWKKGSRQKVKGYLGRIHRFDLGNSVDFLDFKKIQNAESYINENNFKKIISDLIEWEFFKHGINGFYVDMKNKKILKTEKNSVIGINEGHMCGFTLKKLLEIKVEGDGKDGYRLARAFVEAGIKIPQELFIGLFGKLY